MRQQATGNRPSPTPKPPPSPVRTGEGGGNKGFSPGLGEGEGLPHASRLTPAFSEWVVLEVSDMGVGMTEEVRQRCLEPFFSTKGDRGTGLGLAMVFGIVQRHEGEIDIETEPGRGTTFILRLPAIRERGGEEGRRQAEGLSRPLRVLVVDDDPAVRELVIAYLAIDGHTVDSATSGREGLEKFRAGHYDLVLTDRAMPGMGGDQMAAAVKRLAPHKPVIMLTGFGDMMQAADEHPAGVDVILSKPVTRSKLLEAMAKVQ